MMKTRVPSHCDLVFNEPVRLWDEAIPLGNGLMGCLIFGDGTPLKLCLDRADLWDCRPSPEVLAADYTYEELICLVRAGKQAEILRRFDSFYENPTPTKLPAGMLHLEFDGAASVTSRLSLQNAESSVSVQTDGGESHMRVFLSAEDRLGYLKVQGVCPSFRLISHDFTPFPEGVDETAKEHRSSTKRLKYAPSYAKAFGQVQCVVQPVDDGEFALLFAAKETADGCEAVFFVAYSKDGADWLSLAADRLSAALAGGYEQAFVRHSAWWEAFWNKSALRVPDEVLEKHWYLAHYFLGSASRKGYYPVALQGVWSSANGKLPAWKGDYHGDLNLQFSYYSCLKADHLEECEAFLDFFERLSHTAGKTFAETFFDAKGGSCLPSVFAIDGTSLGGWPMYSTTITNQIWELHVFYQYYRYTADEAFWTDRLLPLLVDCEKVVRRWLCEDKNGCLTLPLTASPEINDNNLSAWLPSISNYDLALLRFLYEVLSQRTVDPAYAKILNRLPAYAVDEETGYAIYEGYPLRESHRHFSHLMHAYPLDLVSWEGKDRALVEKSVENLRRLGTDWWVGFSSCWIADLEARLGQGAEAAAHLRQFTDYLCSRNGFHLNGDFKQLGGFSKYTYRPFTLESNMMMAESLQEMLMQCYDGVIRVFPAVPEEWLQDCSFEGLLAFGNVKVSAAARDGRVVSLSLQARRDGDVSFVNPFSGKIETLSMKAGDEISLE